MSRFSVTKLPVYLGVALLIITVLATALRIGNSSQRNTGVTKAGVGGATLLLEETETNSVSVFLVSDKVVAGIDATVKYDPAKVTVLPSSLIPGPSFVTAGGITDDGIGIYSFSAIPKENNVTAGIVGTFSLKSQTGQAESVSLTFSLENDATLVLEQGSVSNILGNTNTLDIQVLP